MKKYLLIIRKSFPALFLALGVSLTMAQNPLPNAGSMPPPPPAGNPMNNPTPPPPMAPSPNPNTPPGWGAPGMLGNPPGPGAMNQGTLNVMATGYDSEGVMKQIPLNVAYNFNGVNYNVTVLSAWNPYTESWSLGLDMPAYSTDYYLNGFTYNWYAPLSIGTFYFNL